MADTCFWTDEVRCIETCGAESVIEFVSQFTRNESTFGGAVAAAGGYVVTGSRYAYASGKTKKGELTLFKNNGGALNEEDSFTSDVIDTYMNLGASVDMDDTHIVVGEVGAYNRASAAYVLTYSGDMLTQTAKLTPSDGGLGDYFGRRVKISGDYIAVQGENDSTGDAQVYIFNLSGASWSEQDTIVIPDYGYLDGLDGDTLIVSDRYADEGGGSDSGAVYVYVRSGSSWAIQATLEASDSSPNLQFGHSAVLNGDYIFASGANNVTYVFKRTGTSWSEISWIIPPAGTLEPAVSAVSGDMKYVAVFGKEDNPDYYDKIIQHKLFMFELGAPDTWEYTQMLTPSLEEDAYTFSWSLYRTSSVAMDNGYLVAGSALSDDDIADRYLSVYSLPSSEGE